MTIRIASLTLLMTASLCLVPQYTLAQNRNANLAQMKQRMAAELNALVDKLELTEKQETPVRAVLEAYNEKRIEMRTSTASRGNFRNMRSQMETLQEETTEKLGELLTEEQIAAYEEHIKSQRNRNRRRGPRR